MRQITRTLPLLLLFLPRTYRFSAPLGVFAQPGCPLATHHSWPDFAAPLKRLSMKTKPCPGLARRLPSASLLSPSFSGAAPPCGGKQDSLIGVRLLCVFSWARPLFRCEGKRIRECSVCHNITDNDPCALLHRRDIANSPTICGVEDRQNIMAIEKR